MLLAWIKNTFELKATSRPLTTYYSLNRWGTWNPEGISNDTDDAGEKHWKGDSDKMVDIDQRFV